MVENQVAALPSQPGKTLNWILLIESLVCGSLALFFLFYFNRLFATIVSLAARTYVWKKYQVHIEFRSIQISLLAGRVFFKDLRYHGQNETILVHSGHITWRYWYRKVKQIDKARETPITSDIGHANRTKHRKIEEREGGALESFVDLPYRLQIKVHGLQWFVYNRSAAYDAIASNISSRTGKTPKPAGPDQPSNTEFAPSQGRPVPSEAVSGTEQPSKFDFQPLTNVFLGNEEKAKAPAATASVSGQGSPKSLSSETRPSTQRITMTSKEAGGPSGVFLQLLPIQFYCHKGAIVLGNESVQCVLTVKFDKAVGEIDIADCRPPDLYKQVINVQFVHPIVSVKPILPSKSSRSTRNPKDRHTGPERATSAFFPGRRHSQNNARGVKRVFQKCMSRRRTQSDSDVHRHAQTPELAESASTRRSADRRWLGLARYLDNDDQDVHNGWNSVDYAKLPTVIDSPSVSISYFWDVAGLAAEAELPGRLSGSMPTFFDQDDAPQWGMNVSLQGGTINYGPWTDKHRTQLQGIFFPRLFHDYIPTLPSEPGRSRTSTSFKLFIEFQDQTIIRIPTKESSKDWKWKMQLEKLRGTNDGSKSQHKKKSKREKNSEFAPEVRPFGWLDVKLATDSTVNYTMAISASEKGFCNRLSLDLRHPVVSSSVNHSQSCQSDLIQATCDLTVPLKWNDLHTWGFHVEIYDPRVFFLREHVFLLSDLITDWSASYEPDYYTFVPFRYLMDIQLHNFNIYLNVNDANIINSPCDLEDNTYIVLKGPALESSVTIPLDKYQPDWNEVPFQIRCKEGQLDLHTPPWKTQAAFLKSEEMGTLENLAVTARYRFLTTHGSSLTDTLVLHLQGSSPTVNLFGFLARYFMKVKTNYFGEDVHFKTLEEYQASLADESFCQNGHYLDRSHSKTNDLDVILSVVLTDTCIHLPAYAYAASGGAQITIATIELELRFTNYYMDITISFSPLSACLGMTSRSKTGRNSHGTRTQLFVDGLDIHGHRLFGLPPTEPTYMCNWDFRVGKVTGDCDTEFLKKLVFGLRNFGASFSDDENALPELLSEPVHDVTFLRAKFSAIHIWCRLGSTAILLSSAQVNLNFHDWATERLSKQLDVIISNFAAACVDTDLTTHSTDNTASPGSTHTLFETTIAVHVLTTKSHAKKVFQLQQKFIERHDFRTARSLFLLRGGKHPYLQRVDDALLSIPSMPLPSMPCTLTQIDPIALESPSDPLARAGTPPEAIGSIHRSEDLLVSSYRSQDSTTTLPLGRNRHEHNYDPVSSTELQHQSPLGICISSPVVLPSTFLAPIPWLAGIRINRSVISGILTSEADTQEAEGSILDTRLEGPRDLDQNASHMAVLLEIDPRTTIFTDVLGVANISQFIDELQPGDVSEVLDDLHMHVLSEVMEVAKQSGKPVEMMSIHLKVPKIGLRFSDSLLNHSNPVGTSFDQHNFGAEYDLLLCALSLSVQFRNQLTNSEFPLRGSELMLVHARLESLKVSLQPQPNSLPAHCPEAHGSIRDVSLWASQTPETSTRVAIREIDLSTSADGVEFMIPLLEQLLHHARISSVSVLSSTKRRLLRLQTLVSFFLANGSTIPDPAPLTRPSYVLRSAPDHIRMSDSWKILCRLRQVFHGISLEETDELARLLTTVAEEHSNLTQPSAVEALNKWVNWDLANAGRTYLVYALYGTKNLSTSQLTTGWLRNVNFKTGLLKAVLDPGPKQSGIEAKYFMLVFNVRELERAVTFPVASSRGRSWMNTFEFYTAQIAINLDWKLCDAVQGVLRYVESHERDSVGLDHVSEQRDTKTATDDHTCEIVLAIDLLRVSLGAISCRWTSACQNLQGSVLATKSPRGILFEHASVHVLAATLEIVKNTEVFLSLSLIRLTLCLLYGQYVQREGAGLSKVAGNCRELVFSTKAELPVLTGLIELITEQELTQLFDIFRALHNSKRDRTGLPAKRVHNDRVSMILALDSYKFSLTLLPNLVHTITGSSARSLVIPDQVSGILIFFEAGGQSHQIVHCKGSETEELSHLRTPPLHGCLKKVAKETEDNHEIQVTINDINFEAAMVSKLLTTLSRTDVIGTVNDTVKSLQSIKTRSKTILRPDEGTNASSEPTRPLLYDCSFILGGISIHADIPNHGDNSDNVHMELQFGRIHLKATNQADYYRGILDPSDVRLVLQRILFQTTRSVGSSRHQSGYLTLGAHVEMSSNPVGLKDSLNLYSSQIRAPTIGLWAETPATLVRIIDYLQNSAKHFDLAKEAQYLRRLRKSTRSSAVPDLNEDVKSRNASRLGTSIGIGSSVEVSDACFKWHVDPTSCGSYQVPLEDLVLSFENAHLVTRKEMSGRLTIAGLQLAMVPTNTRNEKKSQNSALLPEVVFNVAYLSSRDSRRLVFQAAGRSLDVRLSSLFIFPAKAIERSFNRANSMFKLASIAKHFSPSNVDISLKKHSETKRPVSLYIDADFAGSVVRIQSKQDINNYSVGAQIPPNTSRPNDEDITTVFRSPGVALKIEYKDKGLQTRSVNGEVRVDSSANVLYPTVVPLIIQMTSSIQQIIGSSHETIREHEHKTGDRKSRADEALLKGDHSAFLGRCRIDLGLRICKQEFSLSCEPVADVTATTRFKHVYITINTVQSSENGHFIGISAVLSELQVSIQHKYSREPTGSLELGTLVLSMMNSRHLNGVGGISAILKTGPSKAFVNARQIQDFLLFRDIWLPRSTYKPSAPEPSEALKDAHAQAYLVQRYQQVTAAAAFPWNATVAFAEIKVQLDLGRALGNSSLTIIDLWASSRKSSTWEQSLCSGCREIAISGSGRLSGLVILQGLKGCTSIQWPSGDGRSYEVPLIQASLCFDHLRFKIAFDYQVFLVAEISRFHFFMFNVREPETSGVDRLVGTLDGDQVQVFCTATCAGQIMAVYQAIVRLVEEKRASYEAALFGLEKSKLPRSRLGQASRKEPSPDPKTRDDGLRMPLSLHTSVFVTLKGVSVGVFPSTLFDNQVFKLEILDAQARFAVAVLSGIIHGRLGLTLGQLRVAVSALQRSQIPSKTEDIAVGEILRRAMSSRDGTILRVPRVVASMQTWQAVDTTRIDYLFKSTFEGKVDVGWNYSRIGFIRGLWSSHSRALAQRLGKPLSQSAVKVTGGRPPQAQDGQTDTLQTPGQPEKITAVVNVPQSRYDYHALQPPVIETPQLRDMGEATPPLEWIGLHRERLPNLTHQIVIVALLSIAKEVEDAYSKILGSS